MDSSNIFSKFINYLSSGSNSYNTSELSKTKEEMYYSQKDNFIQNSSRKARTPSTETSKMSNSNSDYHGWVSLGSDLFHGSYHQYQYQHPLCYHQTSQLKTSKSLPTIQSVYNINKGCYEDMPISVSQQNYPGGVLSGYQFYQNNNSENTTIWDEMQAQSISGQNLPSTEEKCFHDFDSLVGLVEDTIVESVCVRSRMENNIQNRLAAEILAASSLNPNAKEFTPKVTPELVPDEIPGDIIDQVDGNSELTEDKCNYDEIPVDDDKLDNDKQISTEIGDKKSKNDSVLSQLCCDKNTLTFHCDTSDDESDWDDCDEDDWDWDSDEEQSSVQCVDISEFEDLFQVNLLVTNLGPCQPSPQAVQNPKLADINRKYLKVYPNICVKSGPCCVKFSDDPEIILEPENLAEDLQLARQSDFKQRQADRERMERLIAPILTPTHRKNIYQKIYGEIL